MRNIIVSKNNKNHTIDKMKMKKKEAVMEAAPLEDAVDGHVKEIAYNIKNKNKNHTINNFLFW